MQVVHKDIREVFVMHRSRRIVILLEIGAIGYLTGAVGWALFWLAIALAGNKLWVFLGYLGFPLNAFSFILVGLGCFSIGKLYNKKLPIVAGIVYIITAIPFPLLNSFISGTGPLVNIPERSFIIIGSFCLFTLSLFLWSAVVGDIATPTHHARLATTISIITVISAILVLLSLPPSLLWSPVYTSIFVTPLYVLVGLLSAILLHKISSQRRQKSQNQNSSGENNR